MRRPDLKRQPHAAVGPDLDYAVVGDAVVAPYLFARPWDGTPASIGHTGHYLVGLHYERPFDDVARAGGGRPGGWRVVAGDFVEADEGTGIVHLAPAFGEVDRQVGRGNGLPTLNPVGPTGVHRRGGLAGRAPVRETNGESTTGWRRRAAVRCQPYVHPYPHCWRCETPLIYWGKPSWYVRTSDRKADLVAQNQTIGWRPSTSARAG